MTTESNMIDQLVQEIEKLTREKDELVERLGAARARMKSLEAAVERLQSKLTKCKHVT